MFVVVTGSGNLSVFKRVTRASPCRCRCQVLVSQYVHKAMYNFEEHDQLILLDSRVSHSRWSNIEVTLLVLWYRFVTYLAALC